MFSSKLVTTAALSLFAVAPVLAPRVVADGGAVGVPSLVHGVGQGTVSVPLEGGSGLLAAALLAEDGSRYALDANLSLWLADGIVPGQPFGGVYGVLRDAFPGRSALKAAVQGSWHMISDETGRLDAQVLRADDSGVVRTVGSISAKFRVALPSEDAPGDLGALHPEGFVYEGPLALDFALAE